eukprot:TRINITY_DN9607_c0_g1_i2.p1 TRINITY_DN9607_c0_g1~~TRINITY_DN9607_c0_g1_i2.p1  ORF type:complete len:151 (+),score=55.87 TRINITY_DN9607_c0_g1_i2:268-720(+)
MTLRQDWNLSFIGGEVVNQLNPYVSVEHWNFKKKKDMAVVTRRIQFTSGQAIFIARSLSNKKTVPIERGWSRMQLDFLMVVLTPLPKDKSKTYLQYLEMVKSSGPIQQPTSLKVRSVYRKIELLDGLITIFGPQLTPEEEEEEEEDGKKK